MKKNKGEVKMECTEDWGKMDDLQIQNDNLDELTNDTLEEFNYRFYSLIKEADIISKLRTKQIIRDWLSNKIDEVKEVQNLSYLLNSFDEVKI